MIGVAAYCRVSTNKEDQANSFEAQKRFFTSWISREANWALYEIYADEGITGTSTKGRAAFNRMIRDARMGRFRLILTKEVSRFSRNILDTIVYTRELKDMGIGVVFLNDNINTLDSDAEMRLGIMGAIAQEESRKTSERVKWGQTRQMEQGVVFGPSLLGYDVKNGSMTIEPFGAEVVRLIFQKYCLEQKGTTRIARELREAGVRTASGSSHWSNSHILKILRNEKYVGDLIQKKTYTPNYLTHEKKPNHGEERLVILKDHHAPIIDRALWNMAQAERSRRNRHGEPGAGHSNRYLFSGRIKCGECGASFVSRMKRPKHGEPYRRWSCATAARDGRRHSNAQGETIGCDVGTLLRDDQAKEMVRQSLGSLELDAERIAAQVLQIALRAVREGEQGSTDLAETLRYEQEKVERKKTNLLDAYLEGVVSKKDLQERNGQYDRELSSLAQRLKELQNRQGAPAEITEQDMKREITAILSGQIMDEVVYRALVENLVVRKDKTVEVRFQHLPHRWVYVMVSK